MILRHNLASQSHSFDRSMVFNMALRGATMQQQPLWMMMADEAESDEAVSDDEGIEGFNVSSLSLPPSPAVYYSSGFFWSVAIVRTRSLSIQSIITISMCSLRVIVSEGGGIAIRRSLFDPLPPPLPAPHLRALFMSSSSTDCREYIYFSELSNRRAH